MHQGNIKIGKLKEKINALPRFTGFGFGVKFIEKRITTKIYLN